MAWKGDALEVWVTAPPVGGAANEAVLETVAHELHVSRSRVTLRSGARSRKKVIEVKGAVEGASAPIRQ